MKFTSLFLLSTAVWGQDFVLRNVNIHPVVGAEIRGGAITVVGGKITEVSAKVTPKKTDKVIDGKGLHVYPGLINCSTLLGLSEVTSVRETNDTNEIGEFIPQVRAVVAVNPDSEHIAVTRVNGITTAITLPATLTSEGGRGGAPQGLIRGQATMIHLDGWTWEDMAVQQNAGILMRFPALTTRRAGAAEFAAPTVVPYAEAKRVYDAEIKKIEDFFESAHRYEAQKNAKSADFSPNMVYEAMLPVFAGKVPMLIHAQNERTIREAIAFSKKQKVKIILIDVQRPGKMLDEIKANNIPVIVGKTTNLPEEEDDDYDAAYSLPGQLYKSGIKFAFATYDNQFARNLPYEAAFGVAYGLPYEAALKALTIDAAAIFGVADQIGSLEAGKWADMIVTDGDPLEVKTQLKMLFIKGKNVTLETKQTRLYEKYMGRQ